VKRQKIRWLKMKVKFQMDLDGTAAKAKENKYKSLYMDLAQRISEMSYAKRLQVGCVIIKNQNVISFGWNGMPAGWDNNCEDEIVEYPENMMMIPENEYRYLKTKPEVTHAENNAIAKLAKSTESGDGAVLFVTHAPCLDCAKLVYQSGIRSVFYRSSYRDNFGIEFLQKCGVEVTQHDK